MKKKIYFPLLWLWFTLFHLQCISQTKIKLQIQLPTNRLMENIIVYTDDSQDTLNTYDFGLDRTSAKWVFPIEMEQGQQLRLKYNLPTASVDTFINIHSETTRLIEPPHQFEHYYQVVFKHDFEYKGGDNKDGGISFSATTNSSEYKAQSHLFHDLIQSDTLFILYKSMGCFHLSKSLISIYKKDEDNVTLEYQEKSNYGWRPKKREMRTLTLPEMEELFKQLESECLEIPYGLCTTSSQITFIKNNKVAIFKNSSCRWNGYTDFLKSLNLIE